MAIEQVSQTRRTNAIADGAANWHDPQEYSKHYGAGAEEVDEAARRQGWDEAQTQQAKQTYTRDFAKALVEQASTKDPHAARALLESFGGHLPLDREQLSRQLDHSILLFDARKAADAAFAETTGQPLDVVLGKISGLDNPALKTEAERMIRVGFQNKEQAQQQANQQAITEALTLIKAGKAPDELPFALRNHLVVNNQWDSVWDQALKITQPVITEATPDSKGKILLYETEVPPALQNKSPWESKGNSAFRQKIAESERSAEHANNGYQQQNALGALGRYQITPETLDQVGWKKNGLWSDKAKQHGIETDQDFLDKPDAQEAAMSDIMHEAERQASVKGLYDYSGNSYNGVNGLRITITDSGIIAAAHRHGVGATRSYLRRRAKDQEAKTREEQIRDKQIEKRVRDFETIPYTRGDW